VKTSPIGWTDYSGGALNFVTGCTPVSAGCAHCYARAIYRRFGRDHSVVTTHPDKLYQLAGMLFPAHSPKRGPGHRPMAFVCDTGDLFHEAVPYAFLFDAFVRMERETAVTWQVLTKRAKRMHDILNTGTPGKLLSRHVWLGVSVEDQATADERIPLLLDTPAAVRFVSVEPMLGPVSLAGHPRGIDWVICGAESGPDRRPFDVAWAADLYRECREAGVAYFGKQASGLRPGTPLLIDGEVRQGWPAGSEGVAR
jgi:protein gp37